MNFSSELLNSNRVKEVFDSQYDIDINGDGIFDRNKEHGTWGYDLCGQISLAFVLENLTGDRDWLYPIYSSMNLLKNNPNYTDTTSVRDLAKALTIAQYRYMLPSINQSGSLHNIHYYAYSYGQVFYYKLNKTPDFQNRVFSFESTTIWAPHNYDRDTFIYPDQIRSQLDSGHYHATLVDISTNLGGRLKLYNTGVTHWVVVTGLSKFNYSNLDDIDNWVKIYNPFKNRTEYYRWSEFRNSVHSATSLELWSN